MDLTEIKQETWSCQVRDKLKFVRLKRYFPRKSDFFDIKNQERSRPFQRSCDEIESANVSPVTLVTGSTWLEKLTVPPLLKNSPAEPFLIHYYSDGVGMSGSGVWQPRSDDEVIAEPG